MAGFNPPRAFAGAVAGNHRFCTSPLAYSLLTFLSTRRELPQNVSRIRFHRFVIELMPHWLQGRKPLAVWTCHGSVPRLWPGVLPQSSAIVKLSKLLTAAVTAIGVMAAPKGPRWLGAKRRTEAAVRLRRGRVIATVMTDRTGWNMIAGNKPGDAAGAAQRRSAEAR